MCVYVCVKEKKREKNKEREGNDSVKKKKNRLKPIRTTKGNRN